MSKQLDQQSCAGGLQSGMDRAPSSVKLSNSLSLGKESESDRGGDTFSAEERRGFNPQSGYARILLPVLHSSEEIGRSQAGSRLVCTQQFPAAHSLSNGDASESSLSDQPRRLGDVHRPSGCLLSCSGEAIRQKVPPVCLEGTDLSVPGPSIRTSLSTVHILSVDSRVRNCGIHAIFFIRPQKKSNSAP